jgi:hypothetical protein
MQTRFRHVLALIVAFSTGHVASAAVYAPNRFLGACLTEEWVKTMEDQLGVSASERHPKTKRLLHPFLHAALPVPRYKVR